MKLIKGNFERKSSDIENDEILNEDSPGKQELLNILSKAYKFIKSQENFSRLILVATFENPNSEEFGIIIDSNIQVIELLGVLELAKQHIMDDSVGR